MSSLFEMLSWDELTASTTVRGHQTDSNRVMEFDRSMHGIPIPFIAVVGFHHRRGPELDWIHPPLESEVSDGTEAEIAVDIGTNDTTSWTKNSTELKRLLEDELPFLALPETAHSAEGVYHTKHAYPMLMYLFFSFLFLDRWC
jgi:hypothetical protein